MSDNLKDNEILKEIIRYLNNKMSNEERHSFERAIESDPFLAEAFEGMSGFKSSEIEKDLYAINLIKGNRKRKLKPVVYLSVAASILIIVVSFFLFNKPENEQLASKSEEFKTVHATQPETLLSDGIADAVFAEEADTTRILLAEVKTIQTDKNEPKEKSSSVVLQGKVDRPTVKKQEIKSLKSNDEVAVSSQRMAAIPVNDDIETEAHSDIANSNVRGEELETSSQKITETTINLVDSIGSEDDFEIDENITQRIGHNSSPGPLGGEQLFNAYIDKNIKYPVSEENAKRKVIRVQFTVSVTGDPKNIAIVKAPKNEDFSTEAIRLINEGPRWSPAVKDGLPVEDKVSLRIVFKP